MLKGFKEFVLRGNVIDLAVGVVIGSAFTAIVTALVTGIFNPLIALMFNASELNKAGITLRAAEGGNPPVVLAWGLVIAAVIQFLLVAIVVYFALVVPMNRLKNISFTKKVEEEEAPAVPTELDLLVEIRDLLASQNTAQRGADPNPPFNSGANA
jgi:large conductance mechanosensitive channel